LEERFIEFRFTVCGRFTETHNAFGISTYDWDNGQMAVSVSYRDFVLEQLGRVAPVTARRMFGGVGIYAQGWFFALVAEDRLYFKVDDTTRRDFERLGMEPFRPFGDASAMGYYEVPADVMEDAVQLAPWMNKAINVAAKAKRAKGRGYKPRR
jgi:DNA transformation protein